MSSSLRPRVLLQCSSCLRSYALGGQAEGSMRAGAVTQQVRGKKKVAHAPSTVPVRLLRDVKAFGKKGSIVPIAIGNMRNSWFPRRIAEYVTVPELRQLRLKNTSMERDFEFGTMDLAKSSPKDPTIPSDIKGMSTSEIRDATSKEMKKPLEIEKLSPERSAELVDIFVPPRLEFYRQPIIEEKAPEPEPEPELERPKRERQKFLSNAASDLLAARTVEDKPKKSKAVEAPSIYGSVSSHDVLMAVRAAMGNNDESRRVIIEEEDLRFVGLTSADAGKIKHVGEYALEINVKGVENGIKRTVRVIAQEL